jgi:hypothetical protein
MIGRVAKDPRFETLPCTHKGTYADDCIVDRVTRVRHSLALWFYDIGRVYFCDESVLLKFWLSFPEPGTAC